MPYYPIEIDLSRLTKEELVTKIEELTKRASFMRFNPPVHEQVQLLIGLHVRELDRRRAEKD